MASIIIIEDDAIQAKGLLWKLRGRFADTADFVVLDSESSARAAIDRGLLVDTVAVIVDIRLRWGMSLPIDTETARAGPFRAGLRVIRKLMAGNGLGQIAVSIRTLIAYRKIADDLSLIPTKIRYFGKEETEDEKLIEWLGELLSRQ